MAKTKWSEADRELLRTLYLDRVPVEEIAQRLKTLGASGAMESVARPAHHSTPQVYVRMHQRASNQVHRLYAESI